MNDTMKKRIVAGLLALGMIFSPTGAGITTIPSFAESGVSVNAEDDAAGGDETTENGVTDSDDGENASDEGDADPNNGETGSEEGENDPEKGDADSDDGENDNVEETETEEAADAVIGTTDEVVVFGTDVLPYTHFIHDGVYDIDIGDFAYSYDASSSINWSIYSSQDGYNALNAAQKDIYRGLYNLADSITNSTCSSKYEGKINYVDSNGNTEKIQPIYYFGSPTATDKLLFINVNTDFDDVDAAFTALGYDNPQIFWLGHVFTGWRFDTDRDGSYDKLGITIGTEAEDYSNGSKRAAARNSLQAEIDRVVDGAEICGNGYSAEYYIHDYLCKKTIYDPALHTSGESPFDHDVTGLLLHGVCVCESYAKSTQLLINAVVNTYGYDDLDVLYLCGMAYGVTSSGKLVLSGGHAWNQISLEDQWYNYDATWNDLDPDDVNAPQYSFNFFNTTDTAPVGSTGYGFAAFHHAFEGDDVQLYSAKTCTATKYSIENHEENYSELGIEYNFTVSTNGSVVKKTASIDAALKYITKANKTTADYVINYIGEDNRIDITSAVTVGNARSVSFTGSALYNFSAGFTANCNVVFEANTILGGKVTCASKSITVKGEGTTLQLDKESAADIKSLVLDGEGIYVFEDGADSVNFSGITSTSKTGNVIKLSSDAAIGTMTVTGDLELYVAVDTDVKITGKVTCNGGTKINLIPMNIVDDVLVPCKVANKTTVVTAYVAAESCFKSDYYVTSGTGSEHLTYAVVKDGNAIKLTLAIIEVLIADDENSPYFAYASYANFDKAVAAINADKALNGKCVMIILGDDDESAKLALPSKVKSVIIDSSESAAKTCKLTVTGTTTVTAPTDLYLNNVRISAKSSFTISASKNLTVNGLTSDNLAAIKGTAKGTLKFNKTFGYCSITGFNEMIITKDFESGVINVGTLVIDGCKLNVKQTNASVTVKNIEGKNDAAIVYADGAKLVTVNDTAKGSIKISTDAEKFANSQDVLTAKTADMSVFKLDETKYPDGYTHGYTLTRERSNLRVAKVVMSVAVDEDTLKFAKWSDVVSAIEARNVSDAAYTVKLLDDVNVDGAFKMPKAGTYNKLTFVGPNTFVFTGSITLTGETEFKNITPVSVKKIKNRNIAAAYNISAGKYSLTIIGNIEDERVDLVGVDEYAENARLTNISSNGKVVLNEALVLGNVTANELTVSNVCIEGSVTAAKILVGSEEVVIDNNSVAASNAFVSEKIVVNADVSVGGNLTAKTLLTLHNSLAVKGTFSAVGIEADNGNNIGNVKLYLYLGKKPADIGKTGFTAVSKPVDLVLLDSDGNTVELKTVTVIANIKGKYADHFIPVNENIAAEEQAVGYYIVKSGTKLIAKPKNTTGLIRVKVNGKDGYYSDYESIIKDITTVADPEAEYIIYFGEEEKIDKLTLPGAKKYGKITFAAEGETATIKTLSDLTLTGNFVLDSNVTINKYDRNYTDIVDMNVNAGSYKFACSGKLSYKGDASHFGKLAGSKNSSIELLGNGTWEVSTSVSANNLCLDGTLVLGDKAPLTLTGALTSSSSATVKYPFANASKIKFGKIVKCALNLVSTDSTTITDGTYLANVTGEVLGGITADEFDVIRSGNKLIAGDYNKAMCVVNESAEGGRAGCFYDTFDNAIAGITAANDPDADYTFYIWEDVTVNKLTMPAAKKYHSLTLTKRFANDVTITTSSDLVLTGDLTIYPSVTINKMKSGSITDISINTGTYTFTCTGALSDKDSKKVCNIANITGKGEVVFSDELYSRDVNISGNVNVGRFVVSSTVTLGEKSGFTCAILAPAGGKLVYTEKNATKVKLGKVEYNGKSITFPMLGEGKLLANITGDIALSSVKFGMDDETNLDESYRVARKGNKLYIVKIADAVIMTDEDGINRSYCSPEDALTDIARINDPEGEYLICLNKDWTPKKFALPAKGKYASIKFAFDDVKGATITVPSDINLTGDLIIGNNVTLKKARGTLKITAPKGSGFKASTEGTGKIEGTFAVK